MFSSLLQLQGIMGIFFIESVKLYTSQNIWVFWTAFFISIGFLIGLTCCGDVRRKSPHNMILLSGFTVAEGLMLGVACSTYTAESVLMGKNYELNNKCILIQEYLPCKLRLITKCAMIFYLLFTYSRWNMCIGRFGIDHICPANQN